MSASPTTNQDNVTRRHEKYNEHDEIHGYRVDKVVELKTIDATLYRLTHLNTGARHVHIQTDDKENAFGVTFKTVPKDSTGVAHILEHTALCGSKRYPVRDPFFSMLKRSLSTFMNAFTASDWTMYPFATQNAKDYYHLMDVYLDAAFFPRLEALSFKQEGHRLETEKNPETGKAQGLVYKGVVYNEMKGAMSSADQIMARSMLKVLYPDTTYSNNSGGDPAVIPKLTHEQLVAFHQRHYHPSNAFFYTYGDLCLADHLAFISQKVMAHFSRIDPKTDVPPQPRWQAPRQARFTYPLAPGEKTERKSQVSLAWLLCDIRDTFDVLTLAVLEQVLLGNAGSPLRKRLMESGLGSALSDASGFDADNRDTLFACGLKDTDEETADKIEALILDVLKELAGKGIDRQLVESAIHQIEFHRKEITNTPYPYGLKLLLTIIGSWLHGSDPERILQLDDDFQRLRSEVDNGDFLEDRIRQYFIDNPHRVRMILAPDTEQAEKESQRVQQELKALWETLAKEDLDRIESDAAKLQKSQESDEDISCLPTLALSDIPPTISTCPPDRDVPEPAVWQYTQATSGIFYLKAVAGAAAVPRDLLPWVPFFCFAFQQLGTRDCDYPTLARRIDATMGGFRLSPQARMHFGKSGQCIPMVTMNSKCLTRNLDPGMDIIEELLTGSHYGNTARLKQLINEYQAGLESTIVQNGHRLAISRSARTFSQSAALSEIWSGIEQIKTVRTFTRKMDDAAIKTLGDKLAAIAGALFQPNNVLMAIVGDAGQLNDALSSFDRCKTLGRFRNRPGDPQLPPLAIEMNDTLPLEGWSTSTAVAFVAKTLPTAALGHEDAPALAVLSKILRSLYLHREIREKGGAYGGFALYNPETGSFSLASYRDPQITRTLDVYEAIPDFLSSSPLKEDDLKEAVLQVCSEIDKPDPPGPSARKAFSRLIVGLDDDVRLTFKKQLLSLKKEKVLEVAETYFSRTKPAGGVAVIAGRQHLDDANQKRGGKGLSIDAI